MSGGAAAVLAVVALLGATLSAVTGVGGGVLLLSALLVTLEPLLVVPVHGAVQLVANTSRIVAFRRAIRWRTVLRFGLAVLPGSILGSFFVAAISPRLLQVLLGLGILLSLALPRSDAEEAGPPEEGRLRDSLLGLVCGFLGMVVGSTGPLVSRVLLAAGVHKEEHVGTKAACQAVANVVKVALFGAVLRFSFQEQAGLILGLGALTVVGTIVGKHVLRSMESKTFVVATRGFLALVALKVLSGV